MTDPTVVDLELHADTDAAKREVAAVNKARYDSFLKAAELRVETLPREGIRGKSFAVANLMASKILTGQLEIRNAKEGAEVAKIFYELGRREAGDEDLAITIASPEARARAVESIAELAVMARARMMEALGGPPVEGAEIIDVDEIEAGERAGVPVRSATVGAPLSRVARESVPATE